MKYYNLNNKIIRQKLYRIPFESRWLILLSTLSAVLFFNSCTSHENEIEISGNTISPIEISVSRAFTDKTVYSISERVLLQEFEIGNLSEHKITIDSIIFKISPSARADENVALEIMKSTGYTIEEGGKIKIPITVLVSNNNVLTLGAYLVNAIIKMSYNIDNKVINHTEQAYISFFRVSDNLENLSYNISFQEYNSLPVFVLHGGLSEAYTVQKSLASIAGGISHSWNMPSAGMGPAPIPSTPNFLERSLQRTVELYDEVFGSNGIIETVIISTGIPSGAYLARAMNAPVLPIHFLVGAHTTKEIQTMLAYSMSKGTSAYAAVGHDYSLSNNTAVVWMKLLSLPVQYQEFLSRHQVKNVIFHGALGYGGESRAKKLIDQNEHYGAGSIYVMHFAGDDSEIYLNETIRDFDPRKLGSLINISDWEAGVIEAQVDRIRDELRQTTSIENFDFVTTRNAIHLWNMGSYLMLHLMIKNDIGLKGISFNPYLIGHPVFETREGYVPFLYWQGISPQYHLDNRVNTILKEAIHHYFPDANFKELSCWVNSTNNFGGSAQGVNMSHALERNGFTSIVENNYAIGEVWNLEDGINSSSEVRANILVKKNIDSLMTWNQNLEFLKIEDLEYISNKWPDILVISK